MRPKGGRVINFSLKIPLILEMLYTNQMATIGFVVFKKTKNIKLLTNVARRGRPIAIGTCYLIGSGDEERVLF